MASATGANEDTLFMKRSLAIGVAEIEFAQVALQNSQSDKVKNFAQRMIEDHTAANNKLTAILNGTQYGDGSDTASTAMKMDSSQSGMGVGSGTASGAGTGERTGMDSTGSAPTDSTVRSSTGTNNDSTVAVSTDRPAVAQPPKPSVSLKLSGTYLDIKNKMEALNGTAFDRQYVQQALKDHNLIIRLLEKYQQEGTNAQLKGWVKEQMPVLKEHKSMATKLSASLGGSAAGTKSKN
ncbi:MAG: DUF4142 domain-containing protein [Ferruginibacter sp.]|nr:DUF4142 domain-containing protein [Cytophagales bacterium]